LLKEKQILKGGRGSTYKLLGWRVGLSNTILKEDHQGPFQPSLF